MERVLPTDGRFGSGPSKVRHAQLEALTAVGSPMGTSHRREKVRDVVGRIRTGLTELFDAPDGYEVIMGNGGASALWDAIAYCVVEERAQCAVMGEFSSKAACAIKRAPWLAEPEIRQVEPGSLATCETEADTDTYIYAHNETSTGVISPVVRFGSDAALTVVDGTSAAGGTVVDLSATDLYYFSPQKCFGADGGLWIAFASPAAIERIERLCAQRYVPDFLNLSIAINNSRKDQTYNTPAVATLIMLDNQIQWMLGNGGLEMMQGRACASSDAIYRWTDDTPGIRPLVKDAVARSHLVTTLVADPELKIADAVTRLRSAGVVDIEPYRSLGKDGLRIATFPSIEPTDVELLLQLLSAELAAN